MTDYKSMIRDVADPKGRTTSIEKHEIIEGLVVHYFHVSEIDAAHGSRNDWVEITSIQVNGEHCNPADFPREFMAWIEMEVREYEGLR